MNANRPVKIILLFIIFLALIFYFFVLEKIENNDFITCKILKINSASEFYLDKNNDNLIDDDELVRLDNVVAFKPFLSYETRNYAKKLNFDMEKYLMAGFIAQKFADENLLNSEVKISKKYIKNKNSDVEVYFKGQNLGVFLLKNGLGFVDVDKNDSKTTYYKNFENLNKALDNAEKISNLKFSIVNLRTNVVHKLNCPHIKDIKNAVLVLENSAFYTRNHFCRVCYIEIPKYQTFDYEILKNKYSYNKTFYVKSNEIELYFINPVKFNTSKQQ